MTSTLIVPVNVSALAVGSGDTHAKYYGPQADFSKLPYLVDGQEPLSNRGPYISAVVLEDTQDQRDLPAGIHLHWALPDGLTKGRSTADGLRYPNAPTRWLVTRIDVTDPTQPVLTSWVVESDRLSSATTAATGFTQPTVPLPLRTLKDGDPSWAWLGQAFPLAGWGETPADRLKPLTAVGHGNPAFASFYPNCSSVFGFYDTLADVESSPATLTYHVAGWYDPSTVDPLAAREVTLEPPFVEPATPATYGWSYSTDGGDPPTTTVCAGIVDAITWNASGTYLDDGPHDLCVTVAPSPQEAVSALMAAALNTKDPKVGRTAAEEVLNALQFGLLSGSGHSAMPVAELAEVIQAAGFATLSAGQTWTVRASASGSGQGSEVSLPDTQAQALNALNALQFELSSEHVDREALQFQLFVDWWKYELVYYDFADPPTTLSPTNVGPYLLGEAEAIAASDAKIADLTARVADAAYNLSGSLGGTLELSAKTGAPRYYQAADPLLLLAGEDVKPTDRYGYDGAGSADGTLPCRLDSDVLVGADLAAGIVTGSEDTTIAATALPGLAALPDIPQATLLQALVREAFFAAFGLQPALTDAIAAQGGAANPAILDFGATKDAMQAAQVALMGATAPTDVTYTGTAPDPIYDEAWSSTPPWLPMMMQYRVSLSPVQYLEPGGSTGYPADFITANFTFAGSPDSGSPDLCYQGAAPSTPQIYEGTAILTPGATVDLASRIATFLENAADHDPKLAAALAKLSNLGVLSQALTGLTEALIMRAQTVQLPVDDPLVAELPGHLVDTVRAAVGRQNATAPLPENSFNPIRCGGFEVTNLQLVDVFGRFRSYGAQGEPHVKKFAATVVAQAFRSASDPPPATGTAFLPPRITQPARLLFRWRAASDSQVESNASPATSPILAWLVIDYLDRGLQLYAPTGAALGELSLTPGNEVQWTPAPGGAFPLGTSMSASLAKQSADLVALATRLSDPAFFAPFFDTVQNALTYSLPAQFRETAGQSVLVGQPLALARASLALDIAGPAATDESWATFEAEVLSTEPPGPPDGGLGQVQFPVILGMTDQLDDTLVGYWIDPVSDTPDYETFYSAYVPSTDEQAGEVVAPKLDTLTLTPAGASSSSDVVLLLDPRGSVHATTGILPVKEIDIPSSQYAAALAALSVTFETTPVLSGTNVPAPAGQPVPMVMTQPTVAAGNWSWITVAGGQWAPTALAAQPTSQGTLDYTPQSIAEGWLSLQPEPPS